MKIKQFFKGDPRIDDVTSRGRLLLSIPGMLFFISYFVANIIANVPLSRMLIYIGLGVIPMTIVMKFYQDWVLKNYTYTAERERMKVKPLKKVKRN